MTIEMGLKQLNLLTEVLETAISHAKGRKERKDLIRLVNLVNKNHPRWRSIDETISADSWLTRRVNQWR